jgi:outer membrane receptor protein involved in Fe transport
MSMKFKAALLVSAAAAACAMTAAPAFAQDAPDDAGVTIGEIVVTAQKRAERLSDVPVSVQAVNAESLVQQNLVQIRDFYNRVPGLSVSGGGTEQRANGIAIRGVTTGGGTAPTVAFTLDDVPLTSGASSAQSPLIDVDPSDLARIEVLRGPQGTLYGASSLGGLVKYVTVDPDTQRFSGRVEAGANTVAHGSEGWSLRGAVNVPIVEDKVAVRVSAFTRHDPPYMDNINPADAGKDVNKNRTEGGRVSLLVKPTEDLTLNFGAMRQKMRQFGSPQVRICPDCGTGPYLGSTNYSPFYGDFVLNLAPTEREVNFTLYQARANLNLGFADLTSISAWSKVSSASDLDQTNNFGFLLGPYAAPAGSAVKLINADRTEKFSQEIRLASKSDSKLEWIVGGFYTKELIEVDQTLQVVPAGGSSVTAYHQVGPSEFQEVAIFGDATYHFTDKFDLQVGARYSHNKQNTTQVTTIDAPAVAIFGPSSSLDLTKSSDNATTWLFTPRYKFTSDLMGYVRIATGYRPGGPNSSGIAGIPLSFKSDKVINYEVGLKGQLPQFAASYQLAAFQIDWDDIQLLTTDSATNLTYYTNGSKARSRGVEFLGAWQPVQGLSLNAGATWLEAELRHDLVPPAGASPIFGSKGDRLPGSAKFSASVSADYEREIGRGFSAFGGISVAYVGDRYGDFANILPTVVDNEAFGERIKLPSYTTVDLRGGVFNDDWNLTVYVKNIADKKGVVEATTRGGTSSPQAIFLQPRTVGVTVARTF